MVWEDRNPSDFDAIKDLCLEQPIAVARVDLAAWIIRKSSQDFYIVPKRGQLLGERQSLEVIGLRLKELGDH
jgi:hypothetical protein